MPLFFFSTQVCPATRQQRPCRAGPEGDERREEGCRVSTVGGGVASQVVNMASLNVVRSGRFSLIHSRRIRMGTTIYLAQFQNTAMTTIYI